MKRWMLALVGCLLAAAAHAQTQREIWEWTDANGVKHYSDAPAPGARKLVIVGVTPPSGNAAETTPSSPPDVPRAAPGTNSVSYSALEIWSPSPDQSFFGTDSVVEVRVRSEPGLAPGDQMRTYLDGKQIGEENAYEHVLRNLERGAHTLTSVIFNAQGGEKIRSAPVVFYLKQTAADNPRNRGPALRPQPAPNPAPKPPTAPKSG